MKILFLTISEIGSIDSQGIYTDLLRTFCTKGCDVYSVSPYQKRVGKNTEYIEQDRFHSLRVKVGNLTKCGAIEKGISTLLIEAQYKSAIKKYLSDVKFDLVLYSTPPITLGSVIQYIKKRDNAKSYLMLKDIFPQNAIDIGMMKTTGVMGLMYKCFRAKEKQLYAISDKIGCMSQANVDYVLKHNPEVVPEKVEICPNCIELQDMSITEEERIQLRNKYDIPLNKKVFVYGGNLGKPQGIPFLIECLKSQLDNKDAFFLIVGSGTEFSKLQMFFDSAKPMNMKLMQSLPKDDYDKMIASCDVGMIFLDYRFTIPNFPSRLLAYMQAGLPVLACTDPNTDIGKVIVEGEFGWWCESDDVTKFEEQINSVLNGNLCSLGENATSYLLKNYLVEAAYRTICKK